MKRLVIELDDLVELNEKAPEGDYLNIGVRRAHGTLENYIEAKKESGRQLAYFSSVTHPTETRYHLSTPEGPLLGYRVRDMFIVDVEET